MRAEAEAHFVTGLCSSTCEQRSIDQTLQWSYCCFLIKCRIQGHLQCRAHTSGFCFLADLKADKTTGTQVLWKTSLHRCLSEGCGRSW